MPKRYFSWWDYDERGRNKLNQPIKNASYSQNIREPKYRLYSSVPLQAWRIRTNAPGGYKRPEFSSFFVFSDLDSPINQEPIVSFSRKQPSTQVIHLDPYFFGSFDCTHIPRINPTSHSSDRRDRISSHEGLSPHFRRHHHLYHHHCREPCTGSRGVPWS